MKITFIQVSKAFNQKQIILPTDLEVESGAFTTLLGPSGCGKTTLLRMIAGLETPDSGEIWFDHTCVFSAARRINAPPEVRKLGFVFQDFALWPHMTVFENVAFGLRAQRRNGQLKQNVMQALKTVHLEGLHDRYPHQLSGGQQQRVAFARAIVIEPACILFDEPLSALDAQLREEMRVELKQLVSALGITVVFVTHDQIEAMSMSDKIAVLNAGRVEQYETPENIYHTPATPFVAQFVGKSNWLSEHCMFRPEAISLIPIAGYDRHDVYVAGVQYLGESYELLLQNEEVNWTLRSEEKRAVGEAIPIYIDTSKMVHYEEEGRKSIHV